VTRVSDVLVVGGGIVGCVAALRLRQAGLAVTLLERSVPGAEASSVAAGILGPAIEAHDTGHGGLASPMLALGTKSRERHFDLARELLDEHGIDVGCRRCGVLRVAFGDDDAELESHAAFLESAGVRVRRMSGAMARDIEPNLADSVTAAFELPDEAQVDPSALVRAVAIAAERAGVVFRTGAIVRGIRIDAGRVVGVDLDQGSLDAATVVVAAGSWTSLVPGIPIESTSVYPVRGQVLRTVTRPPLFRRIVFGAGGYVVTRPDGRVVLGATTEHVGFAREATLGGLVELASRGARIAPSLASAPLVDHAVSFRPATRDALPIIGTTGPSGLVIASGHYRNGILLAPITADLVTDLVAHGRRAPELDALDPGRFGPT